MGTSSRSSVRVARHFLMKSINHNNAALRRPRALDAARPRNASSALKWSDSVPSLQRVRQNVAQFVRRRDTMTPGGARWLVWYITYHYPYHRVAAIWRGHHYGRKVARADLLRLEPLRLDWLSGCSLLLQPTAHRPPARFDPCFPLYYEDMDLCLRLAQQGALVLWVPQPAVQHQRGDGSVTPSSRRLELSTTSYVRFLRRYCSPWVTQLRQLRLLLSAFLRPRRSGAIWRGFRRAG